MMSIEEIESACDALQPPDFSRHELEPPELPLRAMFYPYGFSTELRTNREEVLELAGEQWGRFERRHDTPPVRVTVHVTEGGSAECPPTPRYRMLKPLLLTIADAENYSVADMEQGWTHIEITSATMRHRLYVGSLFLGAAPGCHIATRYTTPVHGACVARDGRGILLCGDSGAGKSTLAYACARAGWTYVSDDATYLLRGGTGRTMMGNCHQVRFRPSAAELFPELRGMQITPRMTGKPSVEVATASLPYMRCSDTAQVDFVLFLNRQAEGQAALAPYRKDVARHFMRQVLYGSSESLQTQYAAVERLLTACVMELRYRDLDWAINRLEMLVREGR
jgi:hypothetical protein